MTIRRRCIECNCKNGRSCLEHLRFDVMWRGRRYRRRQTSSRSRAWSRESSAPFSRWRRRATRSACSSARSRRDASPAGRRVARFGRTKLAYVSAFLEVYFDRCVRPAASRSINSVSSRVAVLKHHLGHLPLSALEEADAVNGFKTESEYAEEVELATLHRALETVRAAIDGGWPRRPHCSPSRPFTGSVFA